MWSQLHRFCIAILLVVACRKAEPQKLDFFGTVPSFVMTDQTGQPVGSHDLKGHVVIMNFIFTRCPTVCPVTSMKMKNVADALQKHSSVVLVSISVDPVHDTPLKLAEFAARYHADPSRWKFLTGDQTETELMMGQGLKLALERRGETVPGIPDIVHSVHFVLVDTAGQIRGYYDSDDAARLEKMVEDAKSLVIAAPSAP